ncbi:hypothetical protein Q1695_006852 [Nippostrongylus brasiliensis]|nr:hypothetical protein Q1695_006852 [Nippostrongylus brasiliensis]
MSSGGGGGALRTIINIVLLVLVLAILGISIAVLVEVIQTKNNVNNNNVVNPSKTVNDLNVVAPQPISSGSANYPGYQTAVQLFKSSLNTSVNPCEDFYAYTCGNFTGDMSFDDSDNSNIDNMVKQLTNTTYINSAPSPVQQVAWYFDQCVASMMNWTAVVKDGRYVMNAINRVAAGEQGYLNETQFPFYMLYQSKTPQATFPDPVGLGFLFGYPAGNENAPNLVTPSVDTNWKDPHGKSGYSYFIDQPSTLLPYTYHAKIWDQYQVLLNMSIISTMNTLATTQGLKLDQKKLAADAWDIVQFDHLLAMTYSTDDSTRRQYDRSYNPMTLAQLRATYPKISWHTFLPESVLNAPQVMGKLLADNTTNFIVMEPLKLQMLHDALGSTTFATTRTLVNYVYYQVVATNADFLPKPANSEEYALEEVQRVRVQRPSPGKRRRIRPEQRRFKRQHYNDFTEAQGNCAMETVFVLQYANARAFIDKVYPSSESRQQMRDHVAKVASSILIGFRSMLDQLNWMTAATKKGAYNKIDHLVKNIAYPDWITNDTALTAYHKNLGIEVNKDDYLTMVRRASMFNSYLSWSSLVAGPVNRQDFLGPPGTTNAWYQPELNSITFPAAILHQPFYDPSWPTSVNFGGLGVVAGHELTHGFDDEGVQWEGTGILSGWMDDPSKAAFGTMADCVVKEYDGFCPLNKTAYGSAACLDGAQTQGENIADNGGIHAAFRAYRNFINLYGPDPQLPDSLLQEFTYDQLFFLSFAKVWCQQTPSDSRMETQILVDPHSPSKYRVWGTIQNFPAFKDAFHCPSSPYAPDKHCDVWVSDIDSSYGEPVVKSELNIIADNQITSGDVNKYYAYKQAVNFYQPSVNISADPCNDFFNYACGSYDKVVSFHYADANNLNIMANQLYSPSYQATVKSSTALTKEKAFTDACVNATLSNTTTQSILVTNNYLLPRVRKLAAALGSDFTYVYGGNVAALPDKTQLANGLAYLSFQQSIDTLVTPLVDTNWIDPTKGYRMFLDQNTAYMSKTYYQPDAFHTTEDQYVTTATSVVARFMKEQNMTVPTDLRTKIQGLVEFEQMIALTYSTDDTTRRSYKRSWNLQSVTDLNTNYPFLDWKTYLNQVPSTGRAVVTAAGYQVSVMELEQYKKFSTDYVNKAANLDQTKLVNYLFLRLLLQNAQYLPTYANTFEGMPEEPFVLGRKRRGYRRVRTDNLSDTRTSCTDKANDLMQFANGRVFIDYLYPDENSRESIRRTAGGVIQNVIHSFQGMVDQLDWMTVDVKKKAYDKTAGIVQNIAFPDWILNNTQLDLYYKDLTFDPTKENYYDIWTKLTSFNLGVQYKQLTAAATDRKDFLGQPGTVNAWYQPELNSITFPAGILQPPYFHPLWPASINYGGMGLVAGHELTHGFDDEGVQWGPGGELSPPANENCTGWMDEQSSSEFKLMAQCVIDEYSTFCPLDPKKYTPNCVNGAQTQGENIADNGGIHAAFRAYRTHIALDGPDPLLPDRLFGQFSHDQLFFLNFAQVWCEKRRTDDLLYKQLMVDPHSPSMYRVFGTIQNYPAFQVAYNCPINSAYAPASHCNVWVPKYEP